MAAHEPALRFWLRYAESEGALVEDAGDQALAVLPPALQRSAGLPEDVAVTSDPDVAREDGAVLLIPGHPALEGAATAVLEQGDAGRAYLPWPPVAPLRQSELQARARARLHVEHGRIDAASDARRTYAPLLRVGAAISHAASLTRRLQEQEHVWVDARVALAVTDEVLTALSGRPWLPAADTPHTPLAADLGRALPTAHRMLEERATARSAALSMQARRALEAELARADSYYHGVLESIERRHARAPEDRRRLLEAQAEATHAEHARRRREIADEFRASYEIRPFRLHLLFVPALALPVDVRRGARRFPFELVWLVPAGAFAAVRCPHCGAAAELVAGRDRLGCRQCTGTRPEPTAADSRAAAEDHGRSTTSASGADGPAEPTASCDPSPPTGTTPEGGRRSGPRSREPAQSNARRAGGRPTRARERQPARGRVPRSRGASEAGQRALVRTGDKLALAFWQAVADGTRWPRQKTARDSPLRALYRLYGTDGPLHAIGVPPGGWPQQVTALTLPTVPDGPQITSGVVRAGRRGHQYGLQWWLEAGKPVVGEVQPALFSSGPERLAPAPCVELDPVAAALWRREAASSGMLIAVRCLATWWRIHGAADRSHDPSAVAAAVSGAVARAAAMRRRRADIARSYGADAAAVEAITAELGPRLRLDRDRGW